MSRADLERAMTAGEEDGPDRLLLGVPSGNRDTTRFTVLGESCRMPLRATVYIRRDRRRKARHRRAVRARLSAPFTCGDRGTHDRKRNRPKADDACDKLILVATRAFGARGKSHAR